MNKKEELTHDSTSIELDSFRTTARQKSFASNKSYEHKIKTTL